MKPKTTLNLLKDFFSISIQKTIQFLSSFFEKKTWSSTFEMPYALSLVFNSFSTFSKHVLKNTTVKTDIGKKIKSAPPEENYYYRLRIAIF